MKENEELIQALSDYFVEAGLIPTDSEKAEGLAEYLIGYLDERGFTIVDRLEEV
jgi:DNA-directed RNA polymerase specialized sigma54-like protein